MLTNLVNKDWMALCFSAIVLSNIKQATQKEECQNRELEKK